MKYYSAIKSNEVLTDAGTWINLRKIILESKKPDTKATYDMIPIKWNNQNRQGHRDKK